MRRDDWVVLDTETTGLSTTDEIIEIAVVDSSGSPLLDTLVRPGRPIPPESTRIHGLTNANVASAPRLSELWPVLYAVLNDRTVVIYNADFDINRMLRPNARRYALPWPSIRPECAMKAYAKFADKRRSNGSLVWHRLEDACRDLGVVVGGHRAFGDCLATLEVVRHMATASPDILGSDDDKDDEGARQRQRDGTLADALSDVRRQWGAMKQTTRKRSLAVAALLNSAEPVRFDVGDPPRLTIATPYAFHHGRLGEESSIAIVTWAVQQVLRVPVIVEIAMSDRPGGSRIS